MKTYRKFSELRTSTQSQIQALAKTWVATIRFQHVKSADEALDEAVTWALTTAPRDGGNVRIRLVNVGLIRDATISVSDLTVVMGLNNSGKSTAATALYAAIKASLGFTGRMSARPWTMHAARRPRAGTSMRSLKQTARELAQAVYDSTSEAEEAEALRGHALRVSENLLKDYGSRVVTELESALGAQLADLATRGTGNRRLPFKIVIESGSPAWTVEIRLRGSAPRTTCYIPEPLDFPRDAIRSVMRLPGHGSRRDDTFLLLDFTEYIGESLFADIPQGAHYLPAARAGLLQSHRLVAAAMFQQSTFTGLGEVSMPRLAGVVADFVSEILLSEHHRRAEYQNVAKAIEDEVLGGHVRQVPTETGYPEIEFTDKQGSYPIHRTSSMVSELAPIILLLQRVVQKNDLLIIEEPESHLHPASQVRLARILFQASRLGLRVVLTTHSDFFLTEINNQLRDNVLSKNERASINAYWMNKTEKGSKLHELPIDSVEGIPEESFTEVAEQLYDEQVKQQISLVGSSD